jgi:hypothetical protein
MTFIYLDGTHYVPARHAVNLNPFLSQFLFSLSSKTSARDFKPRAVAANHCRFADDRASEPWRSLQLNGAYRPANTLGKSQHYVSSTSPPTSLLSLTSSLVRSPHSQNPNSSSSRSHIFFGKILLFEQVRDRKSCFMIWTRGKR